MFNTTNPLDDAFDVTIYKSNTYINKRYSLLLLELDIMCIQLHLENGTMR